MIKKGKGYTSRPKFGGNWDNGAKCGSRSSNWNNSPLNLNSNNSSRGVTDTDAEPNSLADPLSLSDRPKAGTAKHATTGCFGLVGLSRKPEAAFL
jgi:hypothetical protein